MIGSPGQLRIRETPYSFDPIEVHLKCISKVVVSMECGRDLEKGTSRLAVVDFLPIASTRAFTAGSQAFARRVWMHGPIERVEKAGGEIFALDHGKLTNGIPATRLSTNM